MCWPLLALILLPHRSSPFPKCFAKVLHSLMWISILITFLKDIRISTSYNGHFSAIFVISTCYELPKIITASTVHTPLYLTTHSFFSWECFLPSHTHPSGTRGPHTEKLPLVFLHCVLAMPSHTSQCHCRPFPPKRYFTANTTAEFLNECYLKRFSFSILKCYYVVPLWLLSFLLTSQTSISWLFLWI